MEFAVGTSVRCRFDGGEELFPGVVAAVRPGGTYDIQYDDGDFEGAVPAVLLERGSRDIGCNEGSTAPSSEVTPDSSSAGGDDQGGDAQDDTYGDASFDEAFESEEASADLAVVVRNKVIVASARRYRSCAAHSSSTLIARPERYRSAAEHGEGSCRVAGPYHEAEPSATDVRRCNVAAATSTATAAPSAPTAASEALASMNPAPASAGVHRVVESRPWHMQCADLEGNARPSADADRRAFAVYELRCRAH